MASPRSNIADLFCNGIVTRTHIGCAADETTSGLGIGPKPFVIDMRQDGDRSLNGKAKMNIIALDNEWGHTNSLLLADVGDQIIVLLPRLRRFALALAGSRENADDLVQSACERALRSSNSWKPGSRLDSWMFRVLRNLWIDHHRRKRVQTSANPEMEANVPGEDGRRTAESRLELAQVPALIATLPEQQRDVLVLVCIEDMPYREAAAILDVPIGTVMSRLARGRQALIAALAENRNALPRQAGGALY